MWEYHYPKKVMAKEDAGTWESQPCRPHQHSREPMGRRGQAKNDRSLRSEEEKEGGQGKACSKIRKCKSVPRVRQATESVVNSGSPTYAEPQEEGKKRSKQKRSHEPWISSNGTGVGTTTQAARRDPSQPGSITSPLGGKVVWCVVVVRRGRGSVCLVPPYRYPGKAF